MTFGFIEILVTLVLLLTGIYYYLTWNYDYWTSRGIVGPKPEIIFGNTRDTVFGKLSLAGWGKELYHKYHNEPIIGVFVRREPVLVLHDMDHIKTVLIKDFNSFINRGETPDIHQPLSFHLFALEAKRWRPLRAKMTPVFTSDKLREMFYLITECGDNLEKYMEGVAGQSVDMRDIAAKFTTDIIGLCAFGVKSDALENEESVFRTMGKRIVATNWKITLRDRMREFTPFLYKYFGGWFVDQKVQSFFINLTRDTVKYREENNVMRHDFIDLLRALRNDPSKIDDIELTDSLMAAQLWVFFLAGFETSSSTISNCLYELAMNPEVQDKLREEIRNGIAETDGKLTYEGIKKMKYLDKVVNETLRKYPPLTSLVRQAATDYTFSGTNITIPADTKIYIPVYGIQHDPRYFPEPETFNPENFSEEAIRNRHQMAFLAFGDGPKNCIGSRFGRIQTKVGIVKVLEKFAVDVCEKTDKEYKLDVRAFFLTPANGIFLKVIKCAS